MDPKEGKDPFQDILASISDGRSPDWDAARRALEPEGESRLNTLRDVADIAAFNRSLQRESRPVGETAAAQSPERWGPLLLLERVGTGARAEVYRAWDAALQREVALKLVTIDPADSATQALLAEGRAAARIRHPNVVVVHGIDHHDGKVGLWMELVRGATLEQHVASRGPCSVEEALRLAADLGAALAAVHEAGIVHRDVKPANIVRDADAHFVLADFGLGRQAATATRTLGPSGTPMYMAPELFAGGAATPASDLYSLGAVLWFALAGRAPFQVGSLAELIAAAERGPTPSLRTLRADLPTGFAALIEKAMAVEPMRRIESARKFLAAFESMRAPARKWWSTRAAKSGLVLVAGIAAAVIVFAVVRVPRRESSRPPVDATTPRTPEEPAAGPLASSVPYSIEASFVRRSGGDLHRLRDGDRVRPGDRRLSLEFRSSRPAFVYVLNEDERGEHYLLFPQPRFDTQNPVPGDSLLHLPGAIAGRENGWTVTSAGGREHFIVVASLEPVPEIEAELGRLPPAAPGRPVESPKLVSTTIERLRGVGGVSEVPPATTVPPAALDRFRALGGLEDRIHGIWVREIAFDNP